MFLWSINSKIWSFNLFWSQINIIFSEFDLSLNSNSCLFIKFGNRSILWYIFTNLIYTILKIKKMNILRTILFFWICIVWTCFFVLRIFFFKNKYILKNKNRFLIYFPLKRYISTFLIVIISHKHLKLLNKVFIIQSVFKCF